MTHEERARLLAEVRALAGASVQKAWLPSAQVCVLQLRVPGETVLAVLDARAGMLARIDARPTAPESAPRSQATLRNALPSACLAGARLLRAADLRDEMVSVDLRTANGPRALIAERGALLLVALDGDQRILWASSGAHRRPGATYPAVEELAVEAAPPLARRAELVRDALASEEAAGLARRKAEALARLRARVKKLRRTLEAVAEDARRAEGAAADRHRAELLLPLQSRVARGAREVTAQDWTGVNDAGEPRLVTLRLDPALSAAENAARWLKRARRYAAAGARIEARRAQVETELAEAERAVRRADEAASAAELALVELPAPSRREREAQGPRLPYRRYRATNGAPVLVGRGARDNDALTFRVARGNDVWLHARGVQGAHVVLPGAGDAPDAAALGDAALLALHFSSARGGDAEVAWTRCKYLRKAKGAPPGAVTYSQEKTLRVRHDDARLAALLSSEE